MTGLIDHIDGAIEDVGGYVLRQVEQGLHFIAQHGVEQVRFFLMAADRSSSSCCEPICMRWAIFA